MASLNSEITIKTSEYRPCFIISKTESKKALFHRWNEFANVLEPSIMVGGQPGGQIRYTLGLVEYEDGTVEEVSPHKIKFVDNIHHEYCFDAQPEQHSEKRD